LLLRGGRKKADFRGVPFRGKGNNAKRRKRRGPLPGGRPLLRNEKKEEKKGDGATDIPANLDRKKEKNG